jgi:hypothetical protein
LIIGNSIGSGVLFFFGVLSIIVGIGMSGVGIIESKPIVSIEYIGGVFALGLGAFLVICRKKLFD